MYHYIHTGNGRPVMRPLRASLARTNLKRLELEKVLAGLIELLDSP